jgi:steroid delta-isomerase-like uncharacterized protein
MSESNKALIRRIYEQGFNEGDPSPFDELYADDFRHHHKTIHDVSRGGAGEKESMQRFRSAIPDVRFTIQDCMAEQDRVMVHLRVTGTAATAFPPIAAGESIDFGAVALFRIVDERVAEEWFYRDPTE